MTALKSNVTGSHYRFCKNHFYLPFADSAKQIEFPVIVYAATSRVKEATLSSPKETALRKFVKTTHLIVEMFS